MTIDELLAAAGLTANDEIPIWDAEATGEPTKKITAQNLAAAVVALANLVTGVKGDAESSYRQGDVNLTPANIGALAKSGDTMTGALGINAVASQEPRIIIFGPNGRNWCLYIDDSHLNFAQWGDGISWRNPLFFDWSTGGVGMLNPLGVLHGGTGATTPDGACANIGAMSRSHVSIYGSDSTSLSSGIQNAVFNIPAYTGTLIRFYYAGSSDDTLTYGASYSGIIHRLSEDGYFFTGSFTNNVGQMLIIYRNGSDGYVSYKRVI